MQKKAINSGTKFEETFFFRLDFAFTVCYKIFHITSENNNQQESKFKDSRNLSNIFEKSDYQNFNQWEKEL